MNDSSSQQARPNSEVAATNRECAIRNLALSPAIALVASLSGLFSTQCHMDWGFGAVRSVEDLCPLDPYKVAPGPCGCGVAEGTCTVGTDSDNDGTPDQNDECSEDPNKVHPGVCGCGVREGDCLTSTDPVITASGENAEAGEGKEMAFDDNARTKWLSFSSSAWIQYEFGGGSTKTIRAYTITSANDRPMRDPSDWVLRASNDGSAWTTMDARYNETFTRRHETRPYIFDNNAAHIMYKLDITSNSRPDEANVTQLAEIELFEDPSDIQIEPPRDELKIVIFSVGSADASLFVFPNGKTMMVDSGTESRCKSRVIPFLERHGIHHIDYYTDTHPHNDHDGGRGPLGDSGHLNDSTDIWHDENDYVDKWKYGDEFDLGGTRWFISNVKDFSKNGSDCNCNSLAFRMEYNGFVYSGTGDQCDNSQDYFLEERADLVQAHVRNTAHHMWGPVSRDFLEATNAYLYVVSNAGDFGSGDGDMDVLESAVDAIRGNGREHKIVVAGRVGHVIIRASSADEWSYDFCSDIDSCVIPDFP